MPKKSKRWFIALFCTLLIPVKGIAQNQDDIEYKFTQTDSSYTFYGHFKIDADPECLLEISFGYEHIRALAINAREVRLIEQGNNWNQISYIYQELFFFKNKTVWHRILDEEKRRVDFTLVSSENSLSIMPQLISSSGFYQVKNENNSLILEYYQQCQVTEEIITNIYLNQVEEEAINFIYRFYEYAIDFCKNSGSKSNKKKIES